MSQNIFSEYTLEDRLLWIQIVSQYLFDHTYYLHIFFIKLICSKLEEYLNWCANFGPGMHFLCCALF